MTWTKITNITAQWTRRPQDPGGRWFEDPWFASWFTPESGSSQSWTKITQDTGEWEKIR